MVITDPRRDDNPIVFANKAFQDLTGYERDEIIGQNCRFLQGPDSDRDAVAKIRDALQAGTDIHIDLLNYRKDGSAFWNELSITPVVNDADQLTYYIGIQKNVTEQVEAQERVKQLEAELADLKAELARLQATTGSN